MMWALYLACAAADAALHRGTERTRALRDACGAMCHLCAADVPRVRAGRSYWVHANQAEDCPASGILELAWVGQMLEWYPAQGSLL